MQRTNRASPLRAARENRLVSALESTGRKIVKLGRDLVPFVSMLGALGAVVGRTAVRPRSLRMTCVASSAGK